MAAVKDDFWSAFEDISQSKAYDSIPLFKMNNKGDKARICFPLVNPKTNEVALKKVLVFNFSKKDAKGNDIWARFIAPEDKECQAYQTAVKYCGDPQTVRVTPVLVYSTNATGNVNSGDDYELIPIKITGQRLEALKAIQAEFNLAEHDISVVCQEKKYQKLDFNAQQACGLRKGSLKVKDAKGNVKEIKFSFTLEDILAEAMEMAKTMEQAVANNWSEQQILDYFSETESDDDEFDDETEEDDELEDEEPAPKSSKKSPKVTEPDEIDDDWDE